MSAIPASRGNPHASDVAVQTALPMVGSVSREDLQTTVGLVDAELAKLFEDKNITLVDGGNINFTGTSVTFSQTLKLILNSKISGASPQTIDLTATTRAFSADGRMLYAVIDRGAGTATITADATSLPAVTSANQEVFLIAKRSDSADGTQRLYFRNGSALNAGETLRLGSAPAPVVDTMELINLGLTTSVAANALTVALKQADGTSNATAGSPVKIAFRSSTLTSGASIERSVTGALSLVVPSGASLGTVSGFAENLYIYAIDNAGTVELAISGINTWDERGLISTTVLDTLSDSVTGIYSTTARSNVPCRLIGRIVITEATAATWATNASAIYVGNHISMDTDDPYKNYLINGGFTYFQQLTGAASSVSHNQFNADRWVWTSSSGGGSGSIGSLSSTDVPNFVTTNSLNTSLWTGAGSPDSWRYLSQWIDLKQYSKLRGKKVTFGVWVKTASGASGGFQMGFYHETSGTARVLTNLQATPANYTAQTITPTNAGWNYYSISVVVPTGATRFAVWLGSNSLSNGNIVYVISQARLNLGTNPVEFDYAGGNIANEFQACKFFYEKISGSFFWPQIAFGTNTIDFQVQCTEKRVVPAVSMSGTANTDYVITNQNGGGTQTGFTNPFTASGITTKGADITATKAAHGLTAVSLRLFSSGAVNFDAEI